MKRTVALILAFVMLFALASCSDVPPTGESFDVTTKDKVNVRMEMADGRIMEFELYPDIAPITVQNFVDLCQSGFYDGLTFHRIIQGFMIQGGDPKGNGTGGSGKQIKGEFSANGIKNDLNHTRGVISMARKGYNPYTGEYNYDSATSQFFIVTAEVYPPLDGQYAAFGKLTKGEDVLLDIETVKTDKNDKPVEPVTIKYIRVID